MLEAERSDYLSRRALSIARTEQRLAVVGIYKALGVAGRPARGRGAVAWLPTIPLQAWHGSATVAPDQPPAFARLPGSRAVRRVLRLFGEPREYGLPGADHSSLSALSISRFRTLFR